LQAEKSDEVYEPIVNFSVTRAMIHSDWRTAREHVEASEALVERQRILIDELRVAGHATLADRAERLLEQLLALKDAQIRHLERMLAEAARNQAPSQRSFSAAPRTKESVRPRNGSV
jgi:hypothetical protein